VDLPNIPTVQHLKQKSPIEGKRLNYQSSTWRFHGLATPPAADQTNAISPKAPAKMKIPSSLATLCGLSVR
jgi:hypothetical protein